MKLSILLFIAIISVSGIYLSAGSQSTQKLKDFLPPPPHVEHYSMGMRSQIADLFWLRSIQDLDYCEEQIAENTCKQNSWLSEMILTVLTLDPYYKIVYRTGGLALTIMISDYVGASKVFNLGVKYFPNDWPLLYAAAYHALYEEKDNKKAADLYLQAAKSGAPEWVYSLANRLYIKSGDYHMTRQILKTMEDFIQDEAILAKIRSRIEREIQPGEEK